MQVKTARLIVALYSERFWSRVDVGDEDECWEWQKYVDGNGYGRMNVHRASAQLTLPAHVIAWVLANNKPFPKNKVGMHTCDNRLCCNPAHIVVGTMSDNSQDAVNKRRWQGNGYPQISQELKQRVLALREEGFSYPDISDITGVSYSSVGRIVRGAKS